VNDAHDPTRGGPGTPGDESVGSVGEEAAKLLGALSGWAREQGSEYAGTAAGAAESLAHAVGDVNEHVATDGQDCRYCPVCQVIHAVRGTSPEVRAHLASAAGSLIQAAAGVLATHTGGSSTGAPVEKIDLDDDSDWDEDKDS
jgi:hypothetical protein